jgi:Spy/CpxP family protein refolding chaperone
VLTAVVLSAGASQAQEQNRQRGGEGAVVVIQERIQDLNLTDAQETKIAGIRKESKPKVEAAAKDLTALVKDEVEKARAVLTPEQRTKLAALKEERQERRIGGLAARLAHLEQLDLTEGEVAKIQNIRKEYRPKIEAALKNLEGLLTPEQKKAREDALKAGKNHREVLAALNLTGAQKEKAENVFKDVGTLVREEMEKIRDVLSQEQQAKLEEFAQERKEHIRDRMAARIVNLQDLNLTDDQKAKLRDIRQEFRPKVHEAGNKLRGLVREEVEAIVAVIKG